MANRHVKLLVQGRPAVDGAGVHLTRVLGPGTIEVADPFLMLDSFDSTNPEDYIKGFPMHPHRGIETITYLVDGQIDHQDSLGNKGTIGPGQSQWMTAGSGIMHQEMPKPSRRMLGLQIWLNMGKSEKMAEPAYFDIDGDMINRRVEGKAEVRVLSGDFKGTRGVHTRHHQAAIFDIALPRGETIVVPCDPEDTVFVFLIEGDAEIGGQRIKAKTAVFFDKGDAVEVRAPKDAPSRFIFFAARPLREPVAWGGPIVMNSDEELDQAFREIHEGTFIKHRAARA